jgi:hypothetical protein
LLPPACLTGLEQALGDIHAGELLVGERHLAVAHPDLPPRRIDEQIADSARPLATGVASTQNRADASGDLLIVERLADALFVWRHPA